MRLPNQRRMLQPNRVIVFTRYPESGLTKTRMIPSLGADRAALLQQSLTNRTLAIANEFADVGACDIEVRYAGGNSGRMSKLFGDKNHYRAQQGSDLGQRMSQAIADAAEQGAQRIVVIGSDCAELEPTILAEAIDALSEADVVLGPAFDGGYYLIGLRANEPLLFTGIDWGTANVRRQTVEKARTLGLKVCMLKLLSDVDHPEDLVVCRRFPESFAGVLPEIIDGRLSIILPTLNDEKLIDGALLPVHGVPDVEMIVADDGSCDVTVNLARARGAAVVCAGGAPETQMNAAAALASGDILLFLDPSHHLPERFHNRVRSFLSDQETAGIIEFPVDGSDMVLRGIESQRRSRLQPLPMPCPAKAFFVFAKYFYDIGGYPLESSILNHAVKK